MSLRPNHTLIDQTICKKCGSCISACPTMSLSMGQSGAYVLKEECLCCGHCESICNNNAIKINSPWYKQLDFSTFKLTPQISSDGPASIVNIMATRRSCRKFKDIPIPKNIIDDIIKIGTLAPSGTNNQSWSFIVLPDRASVKRIGALTENYYKKLNRLAKKPLLRKLLKLVGQTSLDKYHREYLETVESGIKRQETEGKDFFLHNAPAAIVICGDKTETGPYEDPLLATQNMLLGIHAMGLGGCLIGILVHIVEHEKKIINYLQLTKNQKVYAVIALGYPDITFNKATGRTPAVTKYIN